MMKFANNHWWLFDSWLAAYTTGFFQMIIVVLLEVINIALLAANDNILDIIMNFTALVILVELDNILFTVASGETVLAKALQDDELEILGTDKKRSLEKILEV